MQGVLFEVHHAPAHYQHLVGKQVNLRWSRDLMVQRRVQAVTKDVYFSSEARFNQRQGYVHPDRLDYWRRVDPLESLAGARPKDDVIVTLSHPVVEKSWQIGTPESASTWNFYIDHEPVQITGRYYALVRIVEPLEPEEAELFRVVHFNAASQEFDGQEEVVRFPKVVPDGNGNVSSTTRGLERSPMNQAGWYIYGATNAQGEFVVRSIAPRALLRLQPDGVVTGENPTLRYLRKQAWDKTEVPKGQVKSVLLC
ncbi:MAG: CAAX protease, partial [Leptolyngbyaceae cyanobacterium SL_7_1]|nr:CAAX protease [Leptolyngbyaceae cyanobacterium SL_7_1]